MDNFDAKLKSKLEQLHKLVSEKNKAYGDSITSSEKIFKLYYPDGIKPDQYGDVLLLVRVLDKLSRIATAKDAFNEEPWQDIVGYSIRGCLKDDPEEVLSRPELPKYDKTFGDEKDCACGHPYYRHFDTYEGMYPVGCKYCTCSVWHRHVGAIMCSVCGDENK